ncbi:MAG: prenyltransferase/squalene oxidase repeat-containing protein [Candidatus Thorarchaeota archaeon]|jgi:prenyltransferase beta subunit
MRISKVRIRNFRPIVDTGEVKLERDLTVLLGKNEQGKTNFLKALQSFGVDYRYKKDDVCYLTPVAENPQEVPMVTIWFSLDKSDKDRLKVMYDKFEKHSQIAITKYLDNHYEIEKPSLREFMTGLKESISTIEKVLSKQLTKTKLKTALFSRIKKGKHVTWLKSLRGNEGGFGHVPGQPSHIQYSYFATEALSELGQIGKMPKKQLIDFILSCQHPEGGFGHASNQPAQAQFTYYAIQMLRLLKASGKMNRRRHVSWLRSLQTPDGAFSHVKGQPASVSHTYYVVRALSELGQLDQIDEASILRFIKSAEHPEGGFGHLPNTAPNPQFTFEALGVLSELQALDQVERRKHILWLKSLQQPDGGFSHASNGQSHITHTHYAFRALLKLEGVAEIDARKLVKFVLSTEHPEGGFGHQPDQASNAQFTSDAILLLRRIRDYSVKGLESLIAKLRRVVDPLKAVGLIDRIVGKIRLLFARAGTKMTKPILDEKTKINTFVRNSIIDSVLKMIPDFVYYDSLDIIGNSVSMSKYLRNKEKYVIFDDLFKLAELDVESLRSLQDPLERRRLLKEASDRISRLINNSWKQENIRLDFVVDVDEILICIEDDAGANGDRPSIRSEGFRWYLSFFIYFLEETKMRLKDSVILLDNPGWPLHPSGKKDVLSILERICGSNQIVVATHSPFLIDKAKLYRIRIVKREADFGTKVYEKYWDSIHDAFEMVRVAIGADISDSLFGSKNNLIVEGFSDKLYIQAVAKYLGGKGKKSLNLDDVTIIGVGGADKVSYLLCWLLAEKCNTLAILDSDSKGNKVHKDMKGGDTEIVVGRDILKLDEIPRLKGKNIEMEDLFDEEFYNLAVNRTYKEFFNNRLHKPEVSLDEISSKGSLTKRYQRFFKDNSLGGFDKIRVAQEIMRILSKKKVESFDSGSNVKNFQGLFTKVKAKFKKKGVNI